MLGSTTEYKISKSREHRNIGALGINKFAERFFNNGLIIFIKGYFHWKIVLFQKCSTWKANVPFLIYSRSYIFYHFINLEFYDALMNISTQIKVHFWIYLLNHKSFNDKFGQQIGKAMSISFSKMFTWFEGLDPKFSSLFNLVMYDNY